MQNDSKILDLNKLSNYIPLSDYNINMMAEASACCFDLQGHQSGVELSVQGDYKNKFSVVWKSLSKNTKKTYSDQNELVEWGATGIAFYLVIKLTGYTITERSWTGTGFDYWLGYEGEGLLFQKKAKLEISGIFKESGSNTIKKRVKEKSIQIEKSNTDIKGYVVVVEFNKPLSEIKER